MTGFELHARLCEALGILNLHGSRQTVAEALGVSYSAYRSLAGSRSQVPQRRLLSLASRAGLAVLVHPAEPTRGQIEITNTERAEPRPTAGDA